MNGGAENGDAYGWERMTVSSIFSPGHTGQNCFTTKSSVETKLIEIDPQKKYKLSGVFKSNAPKTTLLFGLIPYDQEKRKICSSRINVVKNTETELVRPCTKGDYNLTVKDASNWRTGKTSFPAFEPGKELPNNRLISGIRRIAKVKDGYMIFLATPCEFDYPAGTRIALNRASTGAIFSSALHSPVGSEWQKFEGNISGIAKGMSTDQFWPGTKYVKVLIIKRPRNTDGTLYFDDIRFEEVKEKQ